MKIENFLKIITIIILITSFYIEKKYKKRFSLLNNNITNTNSSSYLY